MSEMLNTKEVAATIRKALRECAPGLSVTMATGTAYGWLHIRPANHEAFTPEQVSILHKFGARPGWTSCQIAPEEHAWALAVLGIRLESEGERRSREAVSEVRAYD